MVYVTIDGELIQTTPEHPFYTEAGEWVNALELTEGDHIQRLDGSFGTVGLVRVVAKTQQMYNFTVGTVHTYFVGDGQWLVHNACRPVKVNYDDAHDLASKARQFRLQHGLDGRSIDAGINQTIGDVAVFEYRLPDGSIQYAINKSGARKHAERRIAEQLPKNAEVTRIFTELHPCGTCDGFIQVNFPDVPVEYSFPYDTNGVHTLADNVDILFGYK